MCFTLGWRPEAPSKRFREGSRSSAFGMYLLFHVFKPSYVLRCPQRGSGFSVSAWAAVHTNQTFLFLVLNT